MIGSLDHSFSADDVDNGLILSQDVLHLFLDQSIVPDEVLQVLLTAEQIFLHLGVLALELLINSIYLVADSPHLG